MSKILIAFQTIKEGFEALEELHEVIRPPQGRDFTQDELADLITDCDVLVSVFDIPIQKELISRGTKLKLIANYAVGYNNIDVDFATSRGIVVTNTPKAVIEPTAELAMSLMLSLSRRTTELDRLIRQQGPKVSLTRIDRMGIDLYGKTLGIIGFGNIGRAVAKRCLAFGMKILYYKRSRLSKEEEEALGMQYADFEEILRKSDVISLHTPYTKASHHQIDAMALAMMKPSALLINTARGAVIDELALCEALQTGQIRGAGLDVFEDQDVPNKALLDLDNVVMTPHVGTQTYDARLLMAKEVTENVLGFLAGSDKISRVN